MPNISNLLFLMVMMVGTTMIISSETWLGMWMGLEMNLIAFIPILYTSKNMTSSESCMIYFLIQSMGSILMLMSVLSSSLMVISPYLIKELFSTMLLLSMMIKLGVPPFHFWFPEILEKMSWTNSMILMTWQKVGPLVIISHIVDTTSCLPVVICVTVLIGAIGGLNQTSIRKIMGYSSINHMGWMIASMKFHNEFWVKYLVIYSVIIALMIYMFNLYSAFYINQLTSNNPKFMEKLIMIIQFLSLGGLPPFLGFLPKWFVIQSMITSNSFTILMIMIVSVLITLFYYLRLVSTTMLIHNSTSKWNKQNQLNKELMVIIITINIPLPLIAMFGL
uniref:NADH-ubiquinone oxidoreductase chain 2 n=1 Tax=Reduvius gregoryi TaxID=1524525 RepID=A0A220QK72_9HEMI|nr:NADH dehydrogenase subunit 2 [Reduvius gregoryi]ASK05195.1 NADH dehydrogenase subunit 2 [Reduvius gregoryi]AVZ00883.1 NADH dehydrogenase subunit 2 [Reduvius gregoryi]